MSKATLDYLLSPQSIRERCGQVFDLAVRGGTQFELHLDKLASTADFVMEVISQQYPDWMIPHHSRWRHFEASGWRMKKLEELLTKASASAQERLRAKWDLAIVSVLLDAGAGADWSYQDAVAEEAVTKKEWKRSEGLAMASFDMFLAGDFSSAPKERPLQADAQGLVNLSAEKLLKGFQITSRNPLVGWEGRLALLQNLGRTLEKASLARPGSLADMIFEHNQSGEKVVSASRLLSLVLTHFGSIWPGRLAYQGSSLGDVWAYPPIGSGDNDKNEESYVPFHKLSQWLTYSLLEPLEEAGITVKGTEELTGLAEYRNGGLMLDAGVLSLRDPSLAKLTHKPDSELIIEWRALTVVILDRLADIIRGKLGKTAAQLPLSRILEGGTWLAGRKLAFRERAGGTPPLKILSDGTVF